jgi:hypothetical protein
MMKLLVFLKKVLSQVQPERMFQKTGLVQSVVPAKKILR